MATVLPADLSLAIPAATVVEIFDDDGDGVADTDVIEHFLDTAESLVLSGVEQIYSDAQIEEMQANPPALYKTLIIWYAVGLAYDRHPEYVRANGNTWIERAHELLGKVRKGELGFYRVGLASPINERAVFRSGIVDLDEPPQKIFSDMGDY